MPRKRLMSPVTIPPAPSLQAQGEADMHAAVIRQCHLAVKMAADLLETLDDEMLSDCDDRLRMAEGVSPFIVIPLEHREASANLRDQMELLELAGTIRKFGPRLGPIVAVGDAGEAEARTGRDSDTHFADLGDSRWWPDVQA